MYIAILVSSRELFTALGNFEVRVSFPQTRGQPWLYHSPEQRAENLLSCYPLMVGREIAEHMGLKGDGKTRKEVSTAEALRCLNEEKSYPIVSCGQDLKAKSQT